MKYEFDCSICKKHKEYESNFTTGYATNLENGKICFECCGYEDAAYMIFNGRIDLYLSKTDREEEKGIGLGRKPVWEVTNWPGTYRQRTWSPPKKGGHNIAGTRYDVWFTGPDGYLWHGVQYGENTQICHCRRTKERV